MKKRISLGILTPSSNTVLEPVTSAIVHGLPDVTVHFSRFTVTEISLGDQALGQFDDTKILDAAKLLADARVDLIGWSGTSASWLGFDADETLCRRITEATGIPATTSVLALNEALRLTHAKTLGLVSPYLNSVQKKIIENYKSIGIDVIAERHLDLSVNYSFAEVTPDQILDMASDVAAARPDALTVLCTNLRGAHLAQKIEEETGVPVYDSVSTVIWKALRMLDYDTTRIEGWGGLFSIRD